MAASVGPVPVITGLSDERTENSLDRLLDVIERHRWAGLTIILVCYWIGVIAMALRRPIWFDEYFSYALAQQSLPELWKSMMTGGDQHPVSFYWISHAFVMLFGKSILVFRLPGLIAHWVMMLCVYSLVSRRSSPLYGFVAMLFPLTTYTLWYATEGRGYALGLGFCALALFCWDAATQGRRRGLAIAGLAASLALAVGSHYYMFLFAIPLGLAELVRTIQRRRIDLPIWAAFCAIALPFIAFWPVIQATRKYIRTFWGSVDMYYLTAYLEDVFSAQFFGVLAILVALGLFALIPSSLRREAKSLNPPEPALHERVALVGIMGMAVYVLIMYFLVTKAYHHRYSLTAVIGFSILTGLACARMTRKRLPALVLAIILLGTFFGLAAHRVRSYTQKRADVLKMPSYFQRFPNLPIVMASTDEWLRWSFYLPSSFQRRLHVLIDAEAGLRITKTDTEERNLTDLHHLLPPGAVSYRSFVATHSKFLVYQLPEHMARQWVPKQLVEDGFLLQTIGGEKGNYVFLAERKSAGAQ